LTSRNAFRFFEYLTNYLARLNQRAETDSIMKLSTIINAINSDAYRFGFTSVDTYCVKSGLYADTVYFTVKGNTTAIFENHRAYDIYDSYGDVLFTFSSNGEKLVVTLYCDIIVDC
jgi:hypothetical protein